MLGTMPGGGRLDVFLPERAGAGPEGILARRAAVAATLLAGLEMARSGSVTLQQEASWQPIHIS